MVWQRLWMTTTTTMMLLLPLSFYVENTHGGGEEVLYHSCCQLAAKCRLHSELLSVAPQFGTLTARCIVCVFLYLYREASLAELTLLELADTRRRNGPQLVRGQQTDRSKRTRLHNTLSSDNAAADWLTG